MDKEELLCYLNINYLGRDDVMRRLPLRYWNDGIWQELMARRRGTAKYLNLKAPGGGKYWYNQTEKMLDAGDRIFEYVIESPHFDARRMVLTDSVMNELIYTNCAEGVMMNLQDAANYLKNEREPQTTNELLLLNNNKAYSFMIVNLYNHYETTYLGGLAYLLLDGIVDLEHIYRSEDRQNIPASQIGALNLKEETYSLPPAKDIPALMEEFCDFLNDEEIHPLIKAAAAQAWILAVRPYSDANERFARLLSTGILLRNGYDFFTGISISRMIFREQYNYFKQMANIMKTENGGDLTYFIEYYIDLLARMVDEIKNPPGKGTEEPPVMGGNVNRQIETVQGGEEGKGRSEAPENNEAGMGPEAEEEVGDKDDTAADTRIFYSLMRRINEGKNEFTIKDISIETGIDERRVEKILRRRLKEDIIEKGNGIFCFSSKYDGSQDDVYKALIDMQQQIGLETRARIFEIVIRMLREGKQAFMLNDLKKELNDQVREIIYALLSLTARNLIRRIGCRRSPLYEFCCKVESGHEYAKPREPTAGEKGIEIILQKMISYLQERGQNEFYRRDVIRLTGDCYSRCINIMSTRGMITPNGNRGWMVSWKQVEKIDIASRIYNEFGEKHFSKNMAQDALNLSAECLGQTLSEMHLLKIIGECEEDGEKWFHFLVNPAESFARENEKAG